MRPATAYWLSGTVQSDATQAGGAALTNSAAERLPFQPFRVRHRRPKASAPADLAPCPVPVHFTQEYIQIVDIHIEDFIPFGQHVLDIGAHMMRMDRGRMPPTEPTFSSSDREASEGEKSHP